MPVLLKDLAERLSEAADLPTFEVSQMPELGLVNLMAAGFLG